MITNFFQTQALKILAGLAALLLAVMLVQTFKLRSADRKIEKQALELKVAAAENGRLKDAAAAMVRDGQDRAARGDQAVKEQEPRSTVIRQDIVRIQQAPAPAPADCSTPKEILNAQI